VTAAAAYLRRLGLDVGMPPTPATLAAVHRAHLASVPYENLAIMLGRPPSVDPERCLDRVARRGRAGYCFHQNAALEAALVALGFRVERRHGHVWTDPASRGDEHLNHLVLVVTGLPTDANPGGRWWPDVGLGEGFWEPLPLVDGEVHDGPFRFRLDDVDEAGWRYTHDPRGSFGGLVVADRRADQAAVAAGHVELSTPPDGAFTRVLVAQRREPGGLRTLRCCVLTSVDGSGEHATDVTSWSDWRAGLVDVVGVPVDDVPADDLHALHERMVEAHHVWDDAGRP
jgi:N-hydroxyarylamine O-acetyltransferase